jgi:feruloyl esterase
VAGLAASGFVRVKISVVLYTIVMSVARTWFNWRNSQGTFMRRFAALAFFFTFAAHAQSPAPGACAALLGQHLADTRILKAEQYAAGEFPTPPGAPESVKQGAKYLPALCRVVAEITPTPDSSIRMEVWMPVEHWNGRFHGQGNGGFAGEIPYQVMGLSVIDGYASAGTDTGHSANFIDASWANGHPEKVADFGYRGIHLMTLRSKELVAAYYGTAAKHSYFAACSDGGREALMEAQRFPADYDGILAGAPANNWTALVTNSLHNAQVQIATPDSYVPSSKLAAITAAVMAKCDAKGTALDGVADGILTDPRACRFKPAELLCKAVDSDSCLTAPQVKTLEAFYAGGHTSDGKPIFPGYAVGGEADEGGWSFWITGEAKGRSAAFGFSNSYFTNMVYPGSVPAFDLKMASLDEAYKAAKLKTAGDLDANDPNLKPFFARGGKLILYHGWNDPAISPLSTIDYYDKVLRATGKRETEDSVRLYMAPGMDHCIGGPGPDSFNQFGWNPAHGPDDPKRDVYLALEQWTEGGMAPAEIIATKYVSEVSSEVKRTRPLCPYPQVAKYKGAGDTDKAESFVCATAKP